MSANNTSLGTNAAVLRQLLTADPEAAFKRNFEGYLPLHSAGQNFCLEVIIERALI